MPYKPRSANVSLGAQRLGHLRRADGLQGSARGPRTGLTREVCGVVSGHRRAEQCLAAPRADPVITDAIGIPKEATGPMRVASFDSAPKMTTNTGTELRVLLDTTDGGQGRMSLATETLKPGQHTTPHWHDRLEEIYYIVAGEGRMEIGPEARPVKAGDAILIPICRTHCLHNIGDTDLVVLCPVSPPWYEDDYCVGEDTNE